MNILIVTDAWHPQLNGVVRTYEYLKSELEAMGYRVTIIGPSDFPYTIPMPGYSEIRLALFPMARLRHIIGREQPDVLHIATEGPLGLAARKYAVEYGVEFTSCYHTHFPDYVAKRVARVAAFLAPKARALAIRFIKWFHAPSSCVFVATPSLENTLREWGFTAPLKRMTRGIDHDLFFIDEQNLFHDLPRPIALYVGRIAVEKNLEEFLDMPWDGSKVLVGDGPDRASLERTYKTAHFLGAKQGKDLADCYRSADVFVFPSKTDTFGMVIVEAMACGLPVAASPVTGPVDIVTEDLLGTLDDDLSEAAHRAYKNTNPDLRKTRAARARAQYSWSLAAQQFLETD